jgi:hypothetical protein
MGHESPRAVCEVLTPEDRERRFVLSPFAHCRSLVQDAHGVSAPDDARLHHISVDAEAGTPTEFPQVQQILVCDRPQDAGVVREKCQNSE